jgi:predicted RND superfamily exporter protein
MTELTAPHPELSFAITGTAPLFLRAQEALLRSLIASCLVAFVVITVVLVVLLRDIPAGLWAMAPNLAPVMLGFGWVSAARIPIDVGTMITASAALGIAIDGSVHLITWFQEERRRGQPRDASIQQALSKCGPALWQATMVIALGMGMMSGADLLLISRFGWLMALLVGLALAGDVLLLPALLAGPLGRRIELAEERRRRDRSSPPRELIAVERDRAPGVPLLDGDERMI